MQIEMTNNNGGFTILLCGELDHHAARQAITEISQIIDSELPGKLYVDLHNLNFMDSSGIAVLLNTQKRVSSYGGIVIVQNVPMQAMRVLDSAGVSKIMEIAGV